MPPSGRSSMPASRSAMLQATSTALHTAHCMDCDGKRAPPSTRPAAGPRWRAVVPATRWRKLPFLVLVALPWMDGCCGLGEPVGMACRQPLRRCTLSPRCRRVVARVWCMRCSPAEAAPRRTSRRGSPPSVGMLLGFAWGLGSEGGGASCAQRAPLAGRHFLNGRPSSQQRFGAAGSSRRCCGDAPLRRHERRGRAAGICDCRGIPARSCGRFSARARAPPAPTPAPAPAPTPSPRHPLRTRVRRARATDDK